MLLSLSRHSFPLWILSALLTVKESSEGRYETRTRTPDIDWPASQIPLSSTWLVWLGSGGVITRRRYCTCGADRHPWAPDRRGANRGPEKTKSDKSGAGLESVGEPEMAKVWLRRR
ncbi:hypothetical protein B0T16DRAFT_205855 [Cercophora newfieldiana]|uniref:Secreted protein n=1 Tax=Cercophora newfieldiana TaxID=92897 RepID=A0AA40CJR8_9PEZI|nr:hypothetical protein B0T16DRAFT_205855 [Cercophora newfieldiana]